MGSPFTAASDPQRIMKRGEVATLFGVTVIRVDQLARAGILRRVKLPGISRSLGYVKAEVLALLAKREAAKQEVKHAS